jgi:hypothetical protein
MSLQEHAELLAYDTVFDMAGALDPVCPIAQLGDLSLAVCGKLRAMAVIKLLSEGDVDRFHHNLIRSGRVWLHYLQRVVQESAQDDHHFVCGRWAPWADCMAADALTLAHQMRSLVPSALRAGHEYPDDYCYARVLQRLTNPPFDSAEVDLLLQQFAEYVETPHHPRLAIAQALFSIDQDSFEEAFDNLLHYRQREIALAITRGELEDAVVLSQREVFVEGLALLRIAEMRGLKTQAEYLFCPSLARQSMRQPFPGE